MLAAIGARARSMKARWIAFDAIDVLLDLLPDDNARRREIARLQEWNELHGLTCLLTEKGGRFSAFDGNSMAAGHTRISYVTDCAIHFHRRETDGVITRSLTIGKYRGSQYAQNSIPYLIGARGIAVYPLTAYTRGYKALTERVSTGVVRLDTLLGNGLTRGSATLLTGAPGTAKTTISGRFAEAACERGERVLYVCFDESGAEIVRNLRSVGIDLGRHEQRGILRVEGMVSRAQSPDALFADIIEAISEHRPGAVVLDPLSALGKQAGEANAAGIGFRIVQECKLRGITLYLTSLVSQTDPASESTELQIATIADTWIHLSYLVRSGERNRAITIVKSRGSAHSNQVRELILSSRGITLENVYSEEGDVLMGTMRSQREAQAEEKRHLAAEELSRERAQKESSIEQLAARIGEQQLELKYRKRELATDASSGHKTSLRGLRDRDNTSVMRGADAPGRGRKRA
jgi:circadian clock protein KaiC